MRRISLRQYRALMKPKTRDFSRLMAWSRWATRLRLNVPFVEWLMGWPIGWTDCAGVATASSQWWQAMRTELSRLSSPPRAAQGMLF